MKYILHIGRHKTGTSALQLFLSNNRDVLRNYGINYPQFENRRTHHDLAFLIRSEGFDVASDKVAKAAEGYDKVIISSEAFSKLKEPFGTAKVIPVGETKVVLYVREYASLLASWYQQNIQSSSRTCGFSEYFSVQNVSHVPVIERWAKVYGKENVEVRLYDRENLIEGDIRRDFLSLPVLNKLPVGQFNFDAADESNKSIAGNLLFFKRILNEFIDGAEISAHDLAIEIALLAKINQDFVGRLAVSAELLRKINTKYRQDRDELEQRYGVSIPERVEPIRGLPVPNAETLMEDWCRIVSCARDNKLQIARYADMVSSCFGGC